MAAFEIADEDLGEIDDEAVEDSGALEDKLIAALLCNKEWWGC